MGKRRNKDTGSCEVLPNIWVGRRDATCGNSIKVVLAVTSRRDCDAGALEPAASPGRPGSGKPVVRTIIHLDSTGKVELKPFFRQLFALIDHGRRLGGIFIHDFGNAATRTDECHDALVPIIVYMMTLGMKFKHAKAKLLEVWSSGGIATPVGFNPAWQHAMMAYQDQDGISDKATRKTNGHILGENLSGWVEKVDDASGKTYYYNAKTKQSLWTKPDSADPIAARRAERIHDKFHGLTRAMADAYGAMGGAASHEGVADTTTAAAVAAATQHAKGSKYADSGAAASWSYSRVCGPMKVTPGPVHAMSRVAFPPEGAAPWTLVTSDAGGRVVQWNCKSGLRLKTLTSESGASAYEHDKEIVSHPGLTGVAYTPSGDFMVSASVQNSHRVWVHSKAGTTMGGAGRHARAQAAKSASELRAASAVGHRPPTARNQTWSSFRQ